MTNIYITLSIFNIEIWYSLEECINIYIDLVRVGRCYLVISADNVVLIVGVIHTNKRDKQALHICKRHFCFLMN